MPPSQYRRYAPRLEVLVGGRTTPRSPHFNYRQTATDWTQFFLIVNNSRMTVPQTLVTEKQPSVTSTRRQTNTRGETTNILTHLLSPCYIERWPNPNLMYTVDHTFGNRSNKFIRACAKSSAHVHGTEIKGANFKLINTSVGHAR